MTDFGLAVELFSQRTEPTGGPDDGPGSTARHGGTLGYAAPEQIRCGPGVRADARVDQFAFGVCLFEALANERPFAATSIARYESAIAARSPAIASVRAPRAVRAVIERALAQRPEHRFADMTALVNALVVARRPRRTARWVAAAAVMAALVGVAMVAIRADAERADARCPAALEVAALWDRGARLRAQARFDATNLPYAEASFNATDQQLQAAVLAWTTQYSEVCQAGPATLSDARFDASLACLQTRRTGLEALTGLLQDANASAVEHAVQSARSLGGPCVRRCRTYPRNGGPTSDPGGSSGPRGGSACVDDGGRV